MEKGAKRGSESGVETPPSHPPPKTSWSVTPSRAVAVSQTLRLSAPAPRPRLSDSKAKLERLIVIPARAEPERRRRSAARRSAGRAVTLHISAARHHHTRKMIRQMVEDGQIPPCAILLTRFKPCSQPNEELQSSSDRVMRDPLQ